MPIAQAADVSMPAVTPNVLTPQALLGLQSVAGNRATAMYVQRSGDDGGGGTGTAVASGARAEVDAALRSRDPGDVKDISDVGVATTSERLDLIRILLDQGWVGPRDEYMIERIWDSFGGSLGAVMAANRQLWDASIDRGAELEDLPAVRALRSRFTADVIALATEYLRGNRAYVMQEMAGLGISPDPNQANAPLTQDQSAQMADMQAAANIVAQLQQGREDLRRVPVGHEHDAAAMPPAGPSGPVPSMMYTRTASFDPLQRPQFPPNAGEPNMKTWDEVKAADDRAVAIISALTDHYPALYAISREGQSAVSGQFADAASPGAAREQLAVALRRLIHDIEGTQTRLNEAGGDLALEMLPLHQQLFASRPGASGTNWGEPLARWAGEYERRDHENTQFWIRLGLESLAAAAFLVSMFASGGLALAIMAGGLAATGVQAAMSAAKYDELSQAARTAVRSGTELVTPGQVSAARMRAQADEVSLIMAAIMVAVGTVAAGASALRALRGRPPSLRVLIGEELYAEYESVINVLKEQHPELRGIPTEDLIAIRGYTNNDWAQLNMALRTGDAVELARLQEYLTRATSGLRQLPSYQGTVTRHVHFSVDMRAVYQEGAIVTEQAFTSTMARGGVAAQREGNTLMIIESLSGKNISLISRVAGENEVLFMPGTRFRVTAVEHGGVVIRMTEVP